MSLVRIILTNSFWLLMASSIGRLTMFLINIMIARILSQETFGQYMVIRSTVSILENLINGTFGSLIIKRVSETIHSDYKRLKYVISAFFLINFTIIIVLSFLLFLFTPYIVDNYLLGSKALVNAQYVASFLLISSASAVFIQSILISFEEFKRLALSSVISSVVSLPIVIILANNYSMIGAILGAAFFFTIDFFFKYFQFRKIYKEKILVINLKNFFSESRIIASFSSPLFLSVVINSIAFWYARVLLINTDGGFRSIAIFDAAFQWLTMIMIFTGATTNVALPMLSKAFAKKEDMMDIFWFNLIINLIISILIATIFIVFSKEIMSIYGASYIKGSKSLIILSLVSVFFTLSSIFSKYMIASERVWIVFTASSLGVVSLFYTQFLLIDRAEQALAYGFMAFYFTNFIVLLGFYKMTKQDKIW